MKEEVREGLQQEVTPKCSRRLDARRQVLWREGKSSMMEEYGAVIKVLMEEEPGGE